MILRNGSYEEAGINPAKIKRVYEIIEEFIDSGHSQAFALLIARNGIIAIHRAFGKHSHEPDSPALETSALFPMSSISKTVAAGAAMILKDEGKLDINAPVCYYVPEFRGQEKDKALVYQLMTHTSGLSDEVIDKYCEAEKDNIKIPKPAENQHPIVLKEVCCVYDAPLWKSPGEEMSYCNYGMELLGDIIRRVCGESYESYVKEKIFKPIGMNDSFLIVPDSEKSRVVRRPDNLGKWFTDPVVLETPFAATGLYSTALDMSKYAQMFLNKGTYGERRILNQDSVAEMTRNQIPGLSAHFFDEFFEEAGWGYGWDIPAGKHTLGEKLSPYAFTHGGGSGVQYVADPQFGIIITMFTVPGEPEDHYQPDNRIPDMVIEAIEE